MGGPSKKLDQNGRLIGGTPLGVIREEDNEGGLKNTMIMDTARNNELTEGREGDFNPDIVPAEEVDPLELEFDKILGKLDDYDSDENKN